MKAALRDELEEDVAGLLRVHAWRPEVLSLYLSVPAGRAEMRGLPRVAGFLAEAAGDGQLTDADLSDVVETVEAGGGDWAGRTVAIFASANLGLHEVIPLARAVPGYEVPERAVLAYRPHILPLLAASTWYPAYRVAVVSRRHAWVFSVGDAGVDDRIEAVAAFDARVASAGLGGLWGLDAFHVEQPIIEFARQPYRDTAAMLARIIRDHGPRPLVIGGSADCVPDLLACLPSAARESFAGTFTADPHALTPARVRDLAAPVVARWAERSALGQAAEIAQLPVHGLGATGLTACLAAVNALAVDRLVVPVDTVVPGYACGICGQVGLAARCPECWVPGIPIPDLLDEMACQVLEDDGHVVVVHGDAPSVTARLRFPVPVG